ncbi:MAG: cupin domain-containing protein [candidate division Zixibacteria bacterium]|nr:cupin domain-containing protein [candidate division Zixibacteria bacterium]
MAVTHLKNLKEITLAEGVTARVMHTENITVAHVRLKAGAEVPEHSHHHEQISNLIEGELELLVDGQSNVLTPGTAIVLPSQVPHAAVARKDCYVIDVFNPAREDLRALE